MAGDKLRDGTLVWKAARGQAVFALLAGAVIGISLWTTGWIRVALQILAIAILLFLAWSVLLTVVLAVLRGAPKGKGERRAR